jgi:hypothetical protein
MLIMEAPFSFLSPERGELNMTLTQKQFVRVSVSAIIGLAVAGLVIVGDLPIPVFLTIVAPLWIVTSGRSDGPGWTTRDSLLAVGSVVLLLAISGYAVGAW